MKKLAPYCYSSLASSRFLPCALVGNSSSALISSPPLRNDWRYFTIIDEAHGH